MMVFNPVLKTLDAQGLQRFQALHVDAVRAVTNRFYTTHGSAYEQFGENGRQSCQDDLSFHLEFLRPVLEFGMLQPMVDYLVWLDSVLMARLVPSEHLAQSLDWLGEFFAKAMNETEGAIVVQALTAARDGLLQSDISTILPALPVKTWPEALAFEAALLRGDVKEALAMMNRMMDAGISLVDLEMQMIQPALYQIGDRWQNNQITVAQEHIASAIVQRVMSAGLVRSPPPIPINKRVLLACVEGNHHAMGLAMVSDAFALAGWQVQYLGANVPNSALIARVVSSLPDLVGLSVSFPQQLRMAKRVMTQLRETLGSMRPAIMVGGLAINQFSRLADVLGADACSANAQLAVARADLMVSPN
jgi:MerR family transcriptional regulator, light-induced transcriptional regulator